MLSAHQFDVITSLASDSKSLPDLKTNVQNFNQKDADIRDMMVRLVREIVAFNQAPAVNQLVRVKALELELEEQYAELRRQFDTVMYSIRALVIDMLGPEFANVRIAYSGAGTYELRNVPGSFIKPAPETTAVEKPILDTPLSEHVKELTLNTVGLLQSGGIYTFRDLTDRTHEKIENVFGIEIKAMRRIDKLMAKHKLLYKTPTLPARKKIRRNEARRTRKTST